MMQEKIDFGFGDEDTLEQKAVAALLEDKLIITLAGKTFEIARPTLATIYEVDAIASIVKDIKIEQTDNLQQIVNDTLRLAKHAKVQSNALAMLILGAKENGYSNIEKELCKCSKLKKFFGICKDKKAVNKLDELSKWIFYNATPKEIQEAVVKIMAVNSECAFFLGSMIFLTGATKSVAPQKKITTE